MPSRPCGILVAACLSMVTMGTTSLLTGALLPTIVADLSLAPTQAGLLASSPGVGYILAVAGAGLLGDWWGFRRIWLLGVAVGLVTLVAISLAPSFGWLLPSIGALGIVLGLFDGCINPVVAASAGERPGSTLNLVHAFFGVGATTAPLVVGMGLRLGWPWRAHYGLLAIYLLLVGGLVLRARFPIQKRRVAAAMYPPRTWLRTRAVPLGAAAMLLYGGVEASVFAWTALYLVRVRALALPTASLGMSMLGGAMLVGRLVCGQVVERLGYKTLVVGGAVSGAAGLALMVVAPEGVWPWVGLAAFGLTFAGIFATVVADATRRAPDYAGTVSGLVCASSGLGKMALPWLVGLVVQTGGLHYGMGIIAASAALLAILYSLV